MSGQNKAAESTLQVTPATLDFGNAGVGKTVSHIATVANTGTTTVTLTKATVSTKEFSISGLQFPISIQAGQKARFTVSFNGRQPGKVKGKLQFTGDPTVPDPVDLTGSAGSTAPKLEISAASHDFGKVTVNTVANTTLTLTNSGAGDLNISKITATGAAFSVTGISVPVVVAAGGTAAVSVSFSPKTASNFSGTVAIASDDPITPNATISLSGSGTAVDVGKLTATPASLSFSNVQVGSSATAVTTLKNTGTANLTLSQISTATAVYSTSGVSVPVVIAPGDSVALTVKFTPTAAGTKGDSVSLINSQGGVTSISLSGTALAVQSSLTVSPGNISFGNVVANLTASQTVQISNPGSASVKVSAANITGTGFSAIGLNLPLTLTGGQSSTFNVQFAPKTAAASSGTVTLVSDATTSTAPITLSGTGIASGSTLSANPSSLSFGNVKVGSSATAVTTLKNTGTANLTLSQISTGTATYSTSGISAPVVIAPGASLTLTVKFAPTAAGTKNDSVSLVDSQGGTIGVSLSGVGVQSSLTVSPGNISFGNVVTNLTNSQTVQITNPSTISVNVTAANITGTGFGTSGLNLPLTLSAGQSSTFNVQFAPKTAAASSGTLTLVSDAATSPAPITLSGTGIAAGFTLSVNPSSVSFGNVSVNATASKNVTVTNTGNSSVAISSVTLSGAQFALTGGSAVTLTPSQSITLTVQFAPTAAGAASGTLTVVSNATSSPATVAVSGSGVAAPVQHTVALSWNASGSAAGYNVYRSGTSGSGYLKINSSLDSGLSYSDSTVQNSQSYFYVTTAVDGAGNESAFSTEVSVSIP